MVNGRVMIKGILLGNEFMMADIVHMGIGYTTFADFMCGDD